MEYEIQAEADGEVKTWFEEFRDADRAHDLVTRRGFKVISIRIKTEESIADAYRRQAVRAERMRKDPIAFARETGDWSEVPVEAIKKEADRIVLTTAFTVAGAEIARELEVITAECAYGVNLFRDFFINVRDLFGGRSAAVQTVLRDARRTALTELRREALMVGADAVIGVDLAYQTINDKILLIVASGTAVQLRR